MSVVSSHDLSSNVFIIMRDADSDPCWGYSVSPSLLYIEFVHQRGIRYAARKHTCKEFTLLLQQAANYSAHN